jgi:hypothetical protein
MNGYLGNLFQGIGQVRPNLGGSYFSEGFSGVVVLDSLKGQNSQKTQVFQIIAEFRILETNMPEKHPVGGSSSFIMSTDKAPWKGNYTGLLAALWGIDPGNEEAVKTNITSTVGEAAIDKSQPCRGRAVMLTTSTGKKTQKGNPLTIHYWKPVDQARYGEQIQQVLSSPTVPGKVEIPAASSAVPAGFTIPNAAPTPPPALPVAAPPALPPAPPAPPSDWQVHPQNPSYEWNTKTGELRPKA